ncbi:MAG: mechanosensitive ion channel [Gemmatimonadetes bacterium]|nr:mechanosensitive ion channel family protein [Gemmatimonadota bacterium]NIQ57169.1 mechanosensitive ion channel family protein [Gemmatimonadota bacterium]NIU77344.1 mechanosensitive ion channel [Gammaproteobacteria bacterium]NIX46602.1 mechanosensitive ion channel [Gemmatimonadota bacterium]NIY10926.1 mechanosensitive ion channel [Gemmatimonadota bacterium]
MRFLAYTFYGNSVQTWLLATALALVVVLALGLVKSFVVRHLTSLSDRTANELDDLAAAVLERTRGFFLFALGVLAGAQLLLLPDQIRDAIRALVFLATLLQLAIWGNAAIGVSLQRYTSRKMEEDAASATTVRFVGFLLRLALWVLIALVALDTAGVDITALIAGLGVGGIAVALAVQNILGDLFASLSIVLDKPFVIGDFIIVGDMMGTVEHIGLKTTRIRSLSGEQLVFSNNDLLSSRIRNYKRMEERRALFRFGVVYQTPREQLEGIPDLVREAVEARDNTRFDRAHFAGFGDSSLDFEVVYYMLVPDYNAYMDTQQAINLELFGRFEELGIDFAYPSRTVYLSGADAD